MRKLIQSTLTAALVCVVLLGCSKKEVEVETDAGAGATAAAPEEPASAGAADVLPGSSDVITALNQNDYSGAVSRLSVLQAAAVTPEQINEYSRVFSEVREKLLEESTKNPKAAEALATLRAMRVGR